ncbi:MAG TPA: serine/threonine-protein kinase [Kofleriaceae bacterium]|nr:serine/threonine-protein kinase [Kofleriaceae bacterium]
MSWVLGEEIGHGALGRVVRVRDPESGDLRAGKILHASNRDDASAVARFAREADLLHALHHPNVVAVHGIETIEGEQVLLMELIDGPSLAQLIAREGTLPEARVVAIGEGIAAGLQAAHRAGLVHRDLKPANVLVAPGDVPKIVDFGLARATSFAGVDRRSFALVGTPDYMAPESADPLAIDPRSDLYSLGCILHEMIAGQPPFGGATPFAVLQAHIAQPVPELAAGPERSQALVHIVRALLAKSPADRPQSAAQVASDLAAVHGLMGAAPAALERAGTCARCGAPLIERVPVCFACGMEQVATEAGRCTVWVTGPGKLTHKLDSGLRQKLLDWIRANPPLGLDPAALAREVPRLPFVLVAGVSEASARRLSSSVEVLGLVAEWRVGNRYALPEIRRKAWSLTGRMMAIAAASMAMFNQLFRFPALILAAVALVPIVALTGGWRMAGRPAARLLGTAAAGLPPALRDRIDRLVGLIPAIEARRHRESLRGAVQRVLALRESVPEAERAAIEAELAHVLDLAMAAAARLDELERRLAAADLRESDDGVRRDLRERDAWAARLLETSAQLDALRARWAAARALGAGAADDTLDELRAQVAAFEEVEAL